MNAADIKSLLDTVVTDINSAADFAGIVDPAIIPFIAIGKAVDKMIPGIASGVAGWIQGNPPTEQEKAEKAAQLAVLGNPDLP